MSRAENAYWKKKLPPGFRYMLEKIGRGVCKGRPKPANVVEFIATYLEFKQSEHAAELAALPEVSYVQKLLAKKARKEASNITAEQGEGASVRAEAIQASAAAAGATSAGATSAAAIRAKEPKGAESKKETDRHASEDVLVKKSAPGGGDKRRSATNLPQAQKSVIEILYPNTSTGKIIADHKKEQVRGASQTSREKIRKETSKAVEIGRQRTSGQYLRETLKGSDQQIAESIIKTPSEPAVKSLSQPIVKVPSETFAPLVPNIKAPSQLLVKNPSPPDVKVPSQSTVKDQSNSVIAQTSIEPSAGREQEEEAGAAFVLIDTQKEVTHVSRQKTAESIPATKSPSQPTVKVSSHSVVPQPHVEPSAGTEQEETLKEAIAQIDAQGEVAHVSQHQIVESIPTSKAPSQTTVKFQSESFSQQALIEKAPSQLVAQAPSQVVVKSPSQPAVKVPSQSTVKVLAYSIIPEAPIELSAGREQEAPAIKTVVQTEADREVAHVSQEHIVELVLAKKSPSQPVVNVPSQQLVKLPSEPLVKSPSQPAINTPSQLAVKPSSQPIVKTSQAAVNVPSQPIAPQEPVEPTVGRELEEPAKETVVQAEVQREIAQVSHQQIAVVDAISQPVIKAPSQPAVKASTQQIVKVPSLPSVKVPSHAVIKAPSQPTVKAPSQSVVNLSQPDVKVPSQSVSSHEPVESAEDRELEEPAKETVIQKEVQKESAQVSQQQKSESIPTVKTPSQPVVKSLSQPVIKVPSQPTVTDSLQQIVKVSSHSIVEAPSQPAVKTSQPDVIVPSQSVAAQVDPTAGKEPEQVAKETTVSAELQRKVAQVSQQQIAELTQTAKTLSQPVVKVLSQPVAKSPSRPVVKASSQQTVKVTSHSVVKAPSQPTVKAPSQPATKTSQPAVKVSSQRIAPPAPVEPTTDRELDKPAKETILQADVQGEVAQVSQQQRAESISTAKISSQSVVKTLSQPVVKSPSRPTVKASSQHIVKVPSLPAVKFPSHSVVKAPSQPTAKAPSQPTVKSPSQPTVKALSQPTVKSPSQPTVKVPSQPFEPAAGRKMDEPGKEIVARVEVQRDIAQVSQQQIAESMPDGKVLSQLDVKVPSQPAMEVPSQPTVKVSSQLIASLEPKELASGKRQVEPADKITTQTEETVGRDLPGQPMEETKPSEVTEVESAWKAEEIAESPPDQPVIISTQVHVAVAEAPANESKAEADFVKWTELSLAETMEDIGIPEVTQTGNEGTKVFDAEIDITFEAETASSLVAIKADAEAEKEEPVHIEVDREEEKEPIIDGEVPADELRAPTLGALANETEVPVHQTLAEGTEQVASLQETKAPVSRLSFEEACAPVQDAPSNEPEISPPLVPTEDTQAPARVYANESEVPVSHVVTEEDSLQEAPCKELDDSSHLSAEAAHAPLEEVNANEPAEQPQATEAFVKEPGTARPKPSAEGLEEELSETSKVVVCQRRLSIELTTIEAEGQAEVSEAYNTAVCQRKAEDQVEAFETSKVAVGPRRLSIDQTAAEAEGEIEVPETSKDSVCQRRLPLEAKIQEDVAETCKVAVCQRRLSVEPAITEAEADAEVSEDPSNTAVCQRKLSVESTVTEAETQAEVSETPFTESGLQAPWPPTEELVAQAEIYETSVEGPIVPIEEPEGYVSNVPAENVQGYIEETFHQESELPASKASLEESKSTAPVLEASSQEHESLASKAPSEELQAPVMKTCSKEPEAFPPSEELLSPALEVPSEERQVASQASEIPAHETEAPIHSVEV